MYLQGQQMVFYRQCDLTAFLSTTLLLSALLLLLLFISLLCSCLLSTAGFEPEDLSRAVRMFWKGISNARVNITDARIIANVSFRLIWNQKQRIC